MTWQIKYPHVWNVIHQLDFWEQGEYIDYKFYWSKEKPKRIVLRLNLQTAWTTHSICICALLQLSFLTVCLRFAEIPLHWVSQLPTTLAFEVILQHLAPQRVLCFHVRSVTVVQPKAIQDWMSKLALLTDYKGVQLHQRQICDEKMILHLKIVTKTKNDFLKSKEQ